MAYNKMMAIQAEADEKENSGELEYDAVLEKVKQDRFHSFYYYCTRVYFRRSDTCIYGDYITLFVEHSFGSFLFFISYQSFES